MATEETMPTIFSRIIAGEIPSVRIYEDSVCIVILDIAPMAKGHCLVIPRECWPTVAECPAEAFAHLMEVVRKVDARLRAVLGADATNIMINNGPAAGQEVPHLHIHVIPRMLDDGLRMKIVKQTYGPGEMQQFGQRLAM
jgi:histidine triad (HIT) family protein